MMMIENKLTETSSLNDVAKAIQGTYSSNKTETYNETILKNLCFVYAITDTYSNIDEIRNVEFLMGHLKNGKIRRE